LKTERTYRLMGLKQAAQKLGIAEQTLYVWCQLKRVPYYKIGRFLKFDEQELNEFIAEQHVV
jgi:excisionase family DNA binding protein